MAKSPFAQALDEFQKQLRPLMKRNGFRVRGRTFNRTTEDGITQVVNLQMSAFNPPGTACIPGFREIPHGLFTINLGVYVSEVARAIQCEAGRFVQEYHCCVRSRLGPLGPEQRDLWWTTSTSPALLAELAELLDRDGFPYLDRFASRDDILHRCQESDGSFGGPSYPGRIVAAIILAERGERSAARRLLERQAQETHNPRHPEYVRALAEQLGIGPLEGSDA